MENPIRSIYVYIYINRYDTSLYTYINMDKYIYIYIHIYSCAYVHEPFSHHRCGSGPSEQWLHPFSWCSWEPAKPLLKRKMIGKPMGKRSENGKTLGKSSENDRKNGKNIGKSEENHRNMEVDPLVNVYIMEKHTCFNPI